MNCAAEATQPGSGTCIGKLPATSLDLNGSSVRRLDIPKQKFYTLKGVLAIAQTPKELRGATLIQVSV